MAGDAASTECSLFSVPRMQRARISWRPAMLWKSKAKARMCYTRTHAFSAQSLRLKLKCARGADKDGQAKFEEQR